MKDAPSVLNAITDKVLAYRKKQKLASPKREAALKVKRPAAQNNKPDSKSKGAGT